MIFQNESKFTGGHIADKAFNLPWPDLEKNHRSQQLKVRQKLKTENTRRLHS